MKKIITLFRSALPLMFGLLLFSQTQAQDTPIVGGSSTTIEQHPWQVFFKGQGYCGGSILSEKWIVTATHCEITVGTQVYIGMTNFNFSTGQPIDATQTLTVAEVYSVPGYGDQTVCGGGCPFLGNDLTLIKVSGTIDLSSPRAAAIEPVWSDILEPDPNNAGKLRFPLGYTGYATGWGEQAYQQNNNPQQLKVSKGLPTIDASTAGVDAIFYQGTGGQHTQFSAGTLGETGQDACRGDSGGPFVIQLNGQWRLAGVTSWGFDCGEANRKGFWASVPHFEDFIKNTTGLFQGPTAGFTMASTPSCVGDELMLQNTSSGADRYEWSFEGADISQSDADSPTIEFIETGNHSITLKAFKGQNEDVVSIEVTIGETDIAAEDIILCEGNTQIELQASTQTSEAVISWFDQQNDTDPVHQGDAYTVDIGTETYTAFVEAGPDNGAQTAKVGKTSPENAGVHGGNQALILDVQKAFVLKSAILKADQAGNRTLELRNTGGTLLDSKILNVPAGTNRVTIDMAIPEGIDLELGFPGNADLYRNDDGTNYPYTHTGVVSIKTSTAGNDYYYYLYDLEIEYGNSSAVCKSERIPVTVSIDATAAGCVVGLVNGEMMKNEVYPNPAQGTIYLELGASSKVTLFDEKGISVFREKLPAGQHQISTQHAGIYTIQLIQQNHTERKRIIVLQ
jgi:hypothetical protein